MAASVKPSPCCCVVKACVLCLRQVESGYGFLISEQISPNCSDALLQNFSIALAMSLAENDHRYQYQVKYILYLCYNPKPHSYLHMKSTRSQKRLKLFSKVEHSLSWMCVTGIRGKEWLYKFNVPWVPSVCNQCAWSPIIVMITTVVLHGCIRFPGLPTDLVFGTSWMPWPCMLRIQTAFRQTSSTSLSSRWPEFSPRGSDSPSQKISVWILKILAAHRLLM